MYDIYRNANKDRWRYALGKRGTKTLYTLGLNPSTATKEKSDTTISKVEQAAKINGYDGFVMINLYPVRATDHNKLPLVVDTQAYEKNIREIEAMVGVEVTPTVWAAWGDNINNRQYFMDAAKEIYDRLEAYGAKWLHFGRLTASGCPRHPSRLSYEWSFSPFDIAGYLKTYRT